MHFIAISWLVLELTDNPFYVGLLVLFGTVPGILSSPFAGVIADRYNRKFIIIAMDILRFVAVLSIPLIGVENMNVVLLYSIVVIITLSSNFFFPAMSGLIKTSFSKEEYIGVLSANSTLIQIGMIGGSGLAGLIIANISIEMVFYIDAITYLISAAFLLFLKYVNTNNAIQKTNNEKFSIFKDMQMGFRYVLGNKVIIFLFLIGILPDAVTHIINTLLSAYTKDVLNMGAAAYGILDASFAVGFVTVGFILAVFKNKFMEQTLLTLGFVIMSFGMVLLALSNSFVVSIAALFTIGMAIILTGPTRKSLLMKEVDDAYIGRVESLNWMVFSSISPLIALLASLSLSFASMQSIFIIVALVLLSGSIICKIYFSKTKIVHSSTNPANL